MGKRTDTACLWQEKKKRKLRIRGHLAQLQSPRDHGTNRLVLPETAGKGRSQSKYIPACTAGLTSFSDSYGL